MTLQEYDRYWLNIKMNTISYRVYRLQISTSIDKFPAINQILGIKPNVPDELGWIFEYIQKEEDEYIPFTKKFLSILDGKYEKLKEIGIDRQYISIWYLYAYNGQCNMEFLPEDMLLLGKEGISFCVSCWDIHDYDADEYDENVKLAEEDNIE